MADYLFTGLYIITRSDGCAHEDYSDNGGVGQQAMMGANGANVWLSTSDEQFTQKRNIPQVLIRNTESTYRI